MIKWKGQRKKERGNKDSEMKTIDMREIYIVIDVGREDSYRERRNYTGEREKRAREKRKMEWNVGQEWIARVINPLIVCEDRTKSEEGTYSSIFYHSEKESEREEETEKTA